MACAVFVTTPPKDETPPTPNIFSAETQAVRIVICASFDITEDSLL